MNATTHYPCSAWVSGSALTLRVFSVNLGSVYWRVGKNKNGQCNRSKPFSIQIRDTPVYSHKQPQMKSTCFQGSSILIVEMCVFSVQFFFISFFFSSESWAKIQNGNYDFIYQNHFHKLNFSDFIILSILKQYMRRTKSTSK